MGIEHEAPILAELDRLPILADVVSADRIDVDHARVAARAIADEARRRNGREADAEIEPLADGCLALDEAHIAVDLAQSAIGHAARPLVGIELLADAAAEADLIQPRAVANLDGEGARANLGEERAGIAFLNGVEAILIVGDQPREHVEPAGRAFGVGEARNGRAELELLDQGHEIDAARFEHRALGQIDLVEFERLELVAHRGVGTREEARADAVGDLAEPEIEACRLDLLGRDLGRALDLARSDQRADGLARQDAGAGKSASRGLGRGPGAATFGKRLKELVARAGGLHGCSWHLAGPGSR